MKNQYFLVWIFFSTRYDPTDCIFSTHSARFRFPPQRAPSMSQNAWKCDLCWFFRTALHMCASVSKTTKCTPEDFGWLSTIARRLVRFCSEHSSSSPTPSTLFWAHQVRQEELRPRGEFQLCVVALQRQNEDQPRACVAPGLDRWRGSESDVWSMLWVLTGVPIKELMAWLRLPVLFGFSFLKMNL